jgi:hypothetical protein
MKSLIMLPYEIASSSCAISIAKLRLDATTPAIREVIEHIDTVIDTARILRERLADELPEDDDLKKG